jgi:ubiquinone/menaquinone biosynthesis C-methylase UbiE
MGWAQSLATRFFYSSGARAMFTNSWYALVSKLDRNAEVTLMNYGYAHADGARIWLEPEHEAERYALQLYHHVATGVPLEGKDVLEVGCGRGGGAAYISRCLKPRQMVGVDRTASSIDFARRHFATQKNLHFKEADAHDLPFEEASFDAVVNIESAQHYHDIGRFFAEVHRVLKPGGHLLIACFEDASKGVFPRQALGRSKLVRVREEDITPGVMRAMELDSARREQLARKLVPPFLRGLAGEFAGVRGTVLYESFATGGCPYLYFVYRK